jgi:hypothetical protein
LHGITHRPTGTRKTKIASRALGATIPRDPRSPTTKLGHTSQLKATV